MPSDCSIEQAQRAYRAKARLIHPDTAAESRRDAATAAMVVLNEAWSLVRASYSQRVDSVAGSGVSSGPDVTSPAWPRASAPSGPPPEQATVPRHATYVPVADADRPRVAVVGECELCGWAPAGPVTFRRTTGLLIVWLWHRSFWDVCSDCADAVYADAQARSLTRGWWGVFAPFATIVSLLRNRVALGEHHRRIGPPSSRAPEVHTPLSSPRPYRSPWLRPSAIGATLLAGAIVAALVGGSALPGIGSHGGSGHDSRLGECVTATGVEVDCVDPAAAWTLVSVATTAQGCVKDGLPRSFQDQRGKVYYCAQSLTS